MPATSRSVPANAKADSPETARKPSSVGANTQYLVDAAVKSGTLTPLGDGRYYANVQAVRRRRNWTIAIVGVLLVLGAWGAWELFT